MNRIGIEGSGKMAVTMGPGSYRGARFETLYEKDGGTCSIGRFTSIGEDVKVFCGGEHHVDWVTTSPILEHTLGEGPTTFSKGPVEIGSNVWIGMGAVIMSGITIGHGAVIAACSMVCKDVEHFEIVGGNPAKHIRYRFTPIQIERLLKISWWDWPEEIVRANRLKLCQPDIDKFINELLDHPPC